MVITAEIQASITTYRIVDGRETERQHAFPAAVLSCMARSAAESFGSMREPLKRLNDMFVKSGIIRE